MVKPTLAFALAVLTALPAVPPVRTMYNDAFARERAVRAAMNEDDADPSVLADLRAVVARYERVVRHYPASSYCDNALWQAAELELDAFVKFGQPQDKDAGLRLLRQRNRCRKCCSICGLAARTFRMKVCLEVRQHIVCS